MNKLQAKQAVATRNTLGEGPLWHPIHRMLYWVDIEENVLHGFEPHTNRHREWPVGKRAGTVVMSADGKLILGLQGEIAEFDPMTGDLRKLVALEADLPDNRCNDGQCDPEGRFWVGTMHVKAVPQAGSLYCIDSGMQPQKVLTGLTISNGMGWSPDKRYMYYIDSHDQYVRRYRFSPTQKSLEDEAIILRFDSAGGLPDGMCVDSEGMLWIAFYGGGRVGRYDPASGKQLADVIVPAPHVTSCCFGGGDLKTLYITTAREELSSEQLDEFPQSGSLFSCATDVAGIVANTFGRKN